MHVLKVKSCLVFEILSGITLDLKNRSAAHQLGNFSPSSTKLCLQKKHTTPICLIHNKGDIILITYIFVSFLLHEIPYQSFFKQFFLLFGPPRRSTIGWGWGLPWRSEHPTNYKKTPVCETVSLVSVLMWMEKQFTNLLALGLLLKLLSQMWLLTFSPVR